VADSSDCGNRVKTNDVVLTVNPLPSCSITQLSSVIGGQTATFKGPNGLTYSWTAFYVQAGVTNNLSGGTNQTFQVAIPSNATGTLT
jgi:hypothetical protein